MSVWWGSLRESLGVGRHVPKPSFLSVFIGGGVNSAFLGLSLFGCHVAGATSPEQLCLFSVTVLGLLEGPAGQSRLK